MTDLLTPIQSTPPVLAEPEMLVEGLRYLQQRIPGFTQLSWQEKRSHARAASLDPEIIETGLHAAVAWHGTKHLVGRSGEELQEDQEEIRRWDHVVVEMRALADGIEAGNLQRKHSLGTRILMIYRVIGLRLRDTLDQDAYMRPYYENMKRAFLRTKQFRKRKTTDEPAE